MVINPVVFIWRNDNDVVSLLKCNGWRSPDFRRRLHGGSPDIFFGSVAVIH